MNVSVIIVNYNTKELTKNCLASIFEKTKDIDFEVIVSDNGSTDGSIEMIKSDFPQVVLIENNVNLGFGKANNIAAKIAKGKYLLFLNSDTILLNNAVKEFFDRAVDEKESVILGSYLCDAEEKICNSYGSFMNPFIFIIKKNVYDFYPKILQWRLSKLQNKKYAKTSLKEKKVDFITGADLFIKKEDFNKINGFDENFFMYFEDEDLCRTAKKNEIQCKIIMSPKIKHLEGASSSVKIRKFLIQDVSFFYYCKKWNSIAKTKQIKYFFKIAFPIRLFSNTFSKNEKQEMKMYTRQMINKC